MYQIKTHKTIVHVTFGTVVIYSCIFVNSSNKTWQEIMLIAHIIYALLNGFICMINWVVLLQVVWRIMDLHFDY